MSETEPTKQETPPDPKQDNVTNLGGVNITATGLGANVAAVVHGSQEQNHYNNSDDSPTLSEVLQPLHDALRGKNWDPRVDTPESIRNEFESPPLLAANIQEMLEDEVEASEVDKAKTSFTAKFKACLPFASKIALEGMKAGFDALVSKHPLVASAKAMVTAAMSE